MVATNSELSPFDLAIDVVGRLLFWTCSVQDVINVTRLDDSNPFGVLEKKEGEKPRLIAIHATKRFVIHLLDLSKQYFVFLISRLIFYTDNGTIPQLVRTRLDGSHRVVITKTSDIAAIAVDTENDLIVWAHGHSISISNIDGENQ